MEFLAGREPIRIGAEREYLVSHVLARSTSRHYLSFAEAADQVVWDVLIPAEPTSVPVYLRDTMRLHFVECLGFLAALVWI
jgi:hypothetical protein